MPHKAFLKKKSLLDRFKDDYGGHTGFIQSARAEHTWNNPLTRYKRTNKLQGWVKSFAGKNHIHKLARFNAMQAGKNEDTNSNLYLAYHISPIKFEKFRLMPKSGMGTTFYGRGIYLTYDKSVIDYYKNLLADYYDNLYIYTVIISPKAKIISDDEIFDYIDDSVDLEDSEQVANLLKNKVDGVRYYNDEDGNSVVIYNADLVSIKSRQEWSMKNEAMSLKGFIENLTEKLTKQFDLDEDEVKNYLDSHTEEMQELLDDKELSLKEKVLFVRSEITGEKDEKKSESISVQSLIIPTNDDTRADVPDDYYPEQVACDICDGKYDDVVMHVVNSNILHKSFVVCDDCVSVAKEILEKEEHSLNKGRGYESKKSEGFALNFPVVVYKGDAENAEKAAKYLWKKIPQVKSAYFACEVKPKDGNNFCRVYLTGPKTFATQMFMTYRDMFNSEFWNDCDASPDGWVDPSEIPTYIVAEPARESKLTDKPWQVKVEFDLDGKSEVANVITDASSEEEAKNNAVSYVSSEYEGSENIVVKDAKALQKNKSERLFNKQEMERIALSEGAAVSPYLVGIAHKILADEYGWTASTKEEVAEWLGDHKQAFEHAYGQALRSSDDDTANVRAGIEAALDEEETGVMNAEIAMMGEGKEMDNRSKVCRENATWVADQIKDLTEGLPVSLKEMSVNTDPDDYYVKYEMTINGKPYEFYSGDDDFTIVDPTNHHEVNGGLSLAYAGNLDLIKFCDELTGGADEAKDDLAGYKSYSFKSDTDDVQANKKEADKVLSEFAEDVKDNTTFEFKYDWYDKSYKVIDTETNSVFQTGKFLFKKFAENKLYLDDGVIDKPAGMKLQVWMAVCKQNEAKEPADEKLSYEKGHKNSKGEDAPWVIRSHKDNRVLASFPTKKEAEDQMQRMKQYSKTESRADGERDVDDYDTMRDGLKALGFELDSDVRNGKVYTYRRVSKATKNGITYTFMIDSDKDYTDSITVFGGKFNRNDPNDPDGTRFSNVKEVLDAMKTIEETKKSEADGDKDVFTIDLFRIYADGDEDMVDDMQAAQTFYDEDKAIKVANELADSYADDDDVVFAVVMAGEREKPNGDIVGEPLDIYWASSSNPAKTAEYRKKARFAAYDGKMDYYAKQTESKKSESSSSDIEKVFKDAAEACGVADKITISTDGDMVYCVMEMDADKYGIDHYKWSFDTKTNELGWHGDESTKGIGARKKFDDMDELKSWIISDIKALFETRAPSNRNEGFSLELIDTIRVPAWLWKAYLFNDTNDLEPDEIETFEKFKETYKYNHLDDREEEPYFSSHNDFDSLGGDVYDVDVYKRSDMPSEKKSEAVVDVIESPGLRKVVKSWDWTCKKCGKPGARFADYDKDGNRIPGFLCKDCLQEMDGEKSEAVKDFPDGKRYKFNFNFYNPKTANIAEQAAKDKGMDCTKEQTIITIAVADPQDAIRFADAVVNLAQSDGENMTDRHDIDKAFNIAVKKDADYEANKDAIDAALTDYVVELTPSPRHNLLYVLGELTDVVDFLEAIK